MYSQCWCPKFYLFLILFINYYMYVYKLKQNHTTFQHNFLPIYFNQHMPRKLNWFFTFILIKTKRRKSSTSWLIMSTNVSRNNDTYTSCLIKRFIKISFTSFFEKRGVLGYIALQVAHLPRAAARASVLLWQLTQLGFRKTFRPFSLFSSIN